MAEQARAHSNAHGPSELAQLTDPNFIIEVAAGPPFPKLVPQQPHTGIVVGGAFVSGKEPKRFILKGTHLSRDDYRIWEASTGKLVAVSSHLGKNPYDSLDPLGLGNEVSKHDNKMGEWESVCHIAGYHGMPSLKVRPKTMSMHGRQYVQDVGGNQTFCNVGKESRLKSLSIRHNLAIRRGRDKELVYRVLIDLAGRTMQVVTPDGDLVAFIQKSVTALVLNAAFGRGSELLIDVAPGVDWTAMLAVLVAIKQVGEHFVKDAFRNYVSQPLQQAAVDQAVEAVGLQDEAAAAGKQMDEGVRMVQQLQQLFNAFYK